MKIPFNWLPAAWGLKGETRELAEAEYYYEGEELERKKTDILVKDEKENKLAHVLIDKSYGHIDELECDEQTAKILYEEDSAEYKLEMLRIRHARNEITDEEYKKQSATINGESYINITNIDSKENSFEFDWNEYFIAELEEAGFGPAPKEEQIVDEWFSQLCKVVALEAFKGDGALDDLEEQEKERKSNLVHIKDLGDGRKVVE